MSTIELTPSTHRKNLHRDPIPLADVPPGKRIELGRVVWVVCRPPFERPFTSILVPCFRCRRWHQHPWNMAWDRLDHVSYQASHCPEYEGAVWLGIDPRKLDESLRAIAEAREALAWWKTEWAARKAEKASAAEAPR